MLWTTMPSPVGQLMLVGDGEALTGIYLDPHKGGPAIGADWRQDPIALRDAVSQLEEYAAGERRDFDLPLAPRGTDFQLRVWAALRQIPYGTTESYGSLARRVGTPTASRAVGAANGRNPLSIVVPCHRVIGADGAPRGYGGGIENKLRLLDLERTALAAG